MKQYKCKCGGTEFFTKESGSTTGLYCKKCGKWIKWLGKDELRLFEHEQSLKIEESKRKYTKDEVAEAIDNLKDWDNYSPFHEAIDKVLDMFENME